MQRGMWAWELKEILQDSLHPRWNTVWIESNRWGERQRRAANLPIDMGTVFFAKADGKYQESVESPFSVRLGQLPEQNVLTLREDGEPDQIYIGWRPLLEKMLKQGFLRPTPKLDHILGARSAGIVPPDSVWKL